MYLALCMVKPTTPKPQFIEVDVEDLAFGGRGVARFDGRVVLVEGGFPGDRVRARVYKRRRSLWEAHVEEVLTPSVHREAPRCQHVGTCGGCKLQGYAYDRQVEAKTSQIIESLRRLGGIPEPPVTEPIAAPEPFEYRNKMEFSFAVDRESGDLICGLHYAGRFDRVFDLKECHLVPPTFSRTVRTVTDLLRLRQVPAYDQRTHEGYARFLVMRRSVATGELLVNFVTTSADFVLREAFVAELTAAVPEITGIVHTISDRRAQVATGEKMEVWFGRDGLTERLGDYTFDLSPVAFFQTNSVQAARLYDLVVEAVGAQGHEHVLDLYCGTGTIGLYLAPHVAAVVGVESTPESVADARGTALHNQVDHAEFIAADVLKWLGESPRPADALQDEIIVLDPPRSGLHPKVPALVHARGPLRIVYVSCNPAALARDVEQFGILGYDLKRVTPIDMFPHTGHIEAVAVLEPRTA
jgi:23S rRNA (uracil1939-C5)-methyltransferase